MHIQVYFSLRSLLLQRIYRTDLNLIRNDSQAAKLVFEYVHAIEVQIWEERDGDFMSLAQAQEASFKISPLFGLSETTLRKYISELWRQSNMADYLKIEVDKFVDYDSRQL